MTKQVDLGLIGFTRKGDWVSGYTETVGSDTYTGYAANDLVRTSDGSVWVSNVDDNTTEPKAGNTDWSVVVDMADVAKILSEAEGIENVDVSASGENIVVTGRDGTKSTIDVGALSAAAINSAVDKATGSINATLSGSVVTITDRTGTAKSVDLAAYLSDNYYTKTEVDTITGDIKSALVTINGEDA